MPVRPMDFVESRKRDFERVFGFLYASRPETYSPGSFVSRYAVVKGETSIGENVLVAQRAYLQNAKMGKGANAQENSYVVDSVLEGYDVGAHGAKIIGSQLGVNVFVGFNSFLRGTPEAPLVIGEGSVVLPHTIIDLVEPVELPAWHGGPAPGRGHGRHGVFGLYRGRGLCHHPGRGGRAHPGRGHDPVP